MKNNWKRIFYIIMLCLLVAIIAASCHYTRVPPGIRKANRIYSRNEKEITIVLDFVRNAKYQSISIDDASGYMYADFKDVKINNADVEAAIKTLIEREDFGFIYKDKGTIEFKIWGYKDVRSYIVWSGDGVDPAVQYTTQIIPMKARGWNYVIADYYKWRKTGDGSLS